MPVRGRRGAGEEGFTLAVVLLAMLIISLIVVATVTAVNGDLRLTERDLDRKQAYEAAQAGVADYAYHLSNDTNYWTNCASVPAPTAVNAQGSTANRKTVPGSSGATYAIELIPATGKPACSTADPVNSMIEASTSSSPGTFRIRSSGYSGDTQQRIVATFKRKSFLDYVYYTQLETSDPLTYGYTGAALAGANLQCSKTEAAGRYDAPIPGTSNEYCDRIRFVDGERINGPLHTNDYLYVCGSPIFGRNSADAIEASAPAPGYEQASGCSGPPPSPGTYKSGAGVITPPATNGALSAVSGVVKFMGTTKVVLSGNSMTVTNNGVTAAPATIPAGGVVYVGSDGACPLYSPFGSDDSTVNGIGPIYPTQTGTSSGCGTVYVSGTYTGKLTIAAENDVIVDGNLCRGSCTTPTGDGLLGLIANNFVRVYHRYSTQTSRSSCIPTPPGGTPVEVKLPNPTVIDAAILSIDHSFIVDHYNCGADLGTLEVSGGISQKFRGPVGLAGSGSPGYIKDYTYDDRLRYISPPKFLDPVQSPWQVQRETLDP